MDETSVRKVPMNEGFLCFTPDTDGDLARRVFVSRFGYEPEMVVLEGRLLWVGPVREGAGNGAGRERAGLERAGLRPARTERAGREGAGNEEARDE